MDKETLALEYFKIQKRYELFTVTARYIAYIVISYIIYLCIIQLAGKTTVANFLFEMITSKEKPSIAPWALLCGAVIWICIERFMRKKNIKYYTARIKKLEKIINNNRTSSNLNQFGNNRPEDLI